MYTVWVPHNVFTVEATNSIELQRQLTPVFFRLSSAEPHSNHCKHHLAFHNLFVYTVAVNEAGDTPLSLECSRGDLKMVKALMNKDVDPNSKCLSVAVILLMVVFHRAC